MNGISKPLDVIVVEDEYLARNLLSRYIEETEQLNLVGTFFNTFDAQNFLQSHFVDVIFLDIHLPKQNGLDFLNNIDLKAFVVLTTAYSKYALQGFDHGVVDYLLKPIEYDRFERAVQRVLDRMTEKKKTRPFITVKENKSWVKIFVDELIYISVKNGYVSFHLTDNGIIRTKGSLTEIQNTLPVSLVRIHKSFLVNKKYIRVRSANTIELIDKTQLPIGRVYKDSM